LCNRYVDHHAMKLKIMAGNHAVGYVLVNARDKEVYLQEARANSHRPMSIRQVRLASGASGPSTADCALTVAQLDDDDLLTAEAEHSWGLGFVGMSEIHPAQLQAIHRDFIPSPDQLDWARRVLLAFEAAGHAALRMPDETSSTPRSQPGPRTRCAATSG